MNRQGKDQCIDNTAKSSDSCNFAAIVIPTFQAPIQRVTPLSLLLQLDATTRPGLTEAQLRNLLAKCSGCGLVMTHRVAVDHQCAVYASEWAIGRDNEVLDLTRNDE